MTVISTAATAVEICRHPKSDLVNCTRIVDALAARHKTIAPLAAIAATESEGCTTASLTTVARSCPTKLTTTITAINDHAIVLIRLVLLSSNETSATTNKVKLHHQPVC